MLSRHQLKGIFEKCETLRTVLQGWVSKSPIHAPGQRMLWCLSCPGAKDDVVPVTSKMDFWNAEQTQRLEIQEAALPGRRDSREARREPDASEFLGGT